MLLERSNYPRLNKRHIRNIERAIFVEHGRFEDFYRIRSSSSHFSNPRTREAQRTLSNSRRFLELEKASAGRRIRDSRIESNVSYFIEGNKVMKRVP